MVSATRVEKSETHPTLLYNDSLWINYYLRQKKDQCLEPQGASLW